MGDIQQVNANSDDEMFLVDEDDENTQQNKYLLFQLGEESYGHEHHDGHRHHRASEDNHGARSSGIHLRCK